MRSIVLAASLLLGAVGPALAQARGNVFVSGDAAVTYHWVHTNAQPGACGCFGLNGGGVSGSWDVRPHLAAVAEVSSEYEKSAAPFATSLTLTAYLAGVRYYVPQPFLKGPHTLHPFVQVMAGRAHAGGAGAGAGENTYAFAGRIGGGLDVPVAHRFVLRALQVEYFPTHFANTVNDHQNNLLIGGGVAYRWSREK